MPNNIVITIDTGLMFAVSSVFVPLCSTLEMTGRLWTIATTFSVLISITSLSYEPIFFLVFAYNVMAWLNMEFMDGNVGVGGDLTEKLVYFHRFKKTRMMKYMPKDTKDNLLRMFQFVSA